MTKLGAMTKKYLKDDSGSTAVEYGLILALMVIAIIAAISATGSANSASLQNTASALPG